MVYGFGEDSTGLEIAVQCIGMLTKKHIRQPLSLGEQRPVGFDEESTGLEIAVKWLLTRHPASDSKVSGLKACKHLKT